MKCLIYWLAAAMCLAGCRAPTPTFKDVSPFGATRIEPPRTHSFGTPDSYYQPPASEKVGEAGTQFDDEPFVSVPNDRVRLSGVAQVGHDADMEGPSVAQAHLEVDDRNSDRRLDDDDLAWGGATSGDSLVLNQENSPSARTYQPGSVAQARYDDDSSYGTVPEPAVLRILDASPLPSESPEELDTASSSDAPRRPPTNNSRSVSTTGSQIQLNPMPVNDVTQFTSNPEPGDLKDIAQLPGVPSHVRDRIERVQAADLPSNSTGILPAVAPERDRAITRSMSSSAMPSAGAGGWRVR